MKRISRQRGSQSGSSLIEVLVTLVILMLGLLGLVGLMVQSQRSQMESYQRVQALVVLDDMVNRINTNRKLAVNYVTASPVGTGMTCAAASTSNLLQNDLSQWCNTLQGAGETTNSGSTKVGGMLGARGCVELVSAGVYRISVVWQGNGKTLAPTTTTCGTGSYGDDAQRRAVTVNVQIASLS